MMHVALAFALAVGTAPAAHDVEGIDATRKVALEQEKLAFCTDPAKPLGPRQRMTCATAREIEGCQALVEACDAAAPAPRSDWLARLVDLLGPVAHALLYLMVLGIVVAVAIPVVVGLLQLRRRSRKPREDAAAPNVATLVTDGDGPPPDEIEPEAALLRAEELLARGDHRRALSQSLTAALSALGRRGVIRLARHRTNGEYVRTCTDAEAKTSLREIVRSVDAVEFGGAEATSDGASRATARARDLVRAAVISATLGVFLLGCEPPKPGTDPAGDELPIAVLARNGYDIKPLASSLATLPVPERPDERAPVVVIDTEKVPLEDETEAHLLRWVEAGGVLVLFGRPSAWPREIAGEEAPSGTRVLRLDVPDPNGGLLDPESDEPAENAGQPIVFEARIGRITTFDWKGEHEVLGRLGEKTYAAKRRLGRGLVLGVANDDLFTNVGVMPKHNAAALVTLIRSVSHDLRRTQTGPSDAEGAAALGELRVARAEDGIPPPSNPFAALVAAGLGKGAWHALAAALLLFLCYGIRHSRPRAAPGHPRRAFVEHVEATGAFYARTPARAHALAVYGRFLELRLHELAPRGSDPATFLASRTGADRAHVAGLLARALEAKTSEVPKGDELLVIEELRALYAKAIKVPSPRRSAP